jgi:hypothetical protein
VNTRVTCPSCKKTGTVPEASVGKRIKCPNCANRFEVLAPQPPPSIYDDEEPSNEPLPPTRLLPRSAPRKSATGAVLSPPVILALVGVVGAIAILLISVQ